MSAGGGGGGGVRCERVVESGTAVRDCISIFVSMEETTRHGHDLFRTLTKWFRLKIEPKKLQHEDI